MIVWAGLFIANTILLVVNVINRDAPLAALNIAGMAVVGWGLYFDLRSKRPQARLDRLRRLNSMGDQRN